MLQAIILSKWCAYTQGHNLSLLQIILGLVLKLLIFCMVCVVACVLFCWLDPPSEWFLFFCLTSGGWLCWLQMEVCGIELFLIMPCYLIFLSGVKFLLDFFLLLGSQVDGFQLGIFLYLKIALKSFKLMYLSLFHNDFAHCTQLKWSCSHS
jgi:hypothetical protein